MRYTVINLYRLFQITANNRASVEHSMLCKRVEILRSGRQTVNVGQTVPGITGCISCVLIFFFVILFTGCQSSPDQNVLKMGNTKIFQKAYEASDIGDYNLALSYYTTYQNLFPADIGGNLWALYEIAFIYHKMGNDKEAILRFEELLKKYETEGTSAWPQAQKILAEHVLKDLKKNIKTESATDKKIENK
jgi:outer membrane protein assembly factor BamD (BamD/ComL family)